MHRWLVSISSLADAATRPAGPMERLILHSGYGYIFVALILIGGGFGLPLPEDIPLLLGGVLISQAGADPWIMFPLCMACIFGADCTLYLLGRRYGHHIPKLPLLGRILTEARLAKAERVFQRYGGRTLFAARFMPGLRTPIFFSAGVFRIPFWKMLVFDGTAGLISVPTLIALGWFFGNKWEEAKKGAHDAQVVLGVVIVVAVVGTVGFKIWRSRRRKIEEARPAA